jgi:hypothetical protein
MGDQHTRPGEPAQRFLPQIDADEARPGREPVRQVQGGEDANTRATECGDRFSISDRQIGGNCGLPDQS